MSRFKIEAFVIRSSRMTESSRLVTFFTKEHGKLKGVAKGAGRLKSKLAGKIELFNLIEGDFYKKEIAELGILSNAGLLEDFRNIAEDARKFGFASAWCEVIDRTSQLEEPRPETFELTLELFRAMHTARSEAAGLLFWSALFRFIAIEGYTPGLYSCISCGKEIPSNQLMISLSRGGLICADCIEIDEPFIRLTQPTLDLLRQMMASPLSEMADMAIDTKTGRAAAEVTLSLAAYHMNLPRNLKSFKFLEGISDSGRMGT